MIKKIVLLLFVSNCFGAEKKASFRNSPALNNTVRSFEELKEVNDEAKKKVNELVVIAAVLGNDVQGAEKSTKETVDDLKEAKESFRIKKEEREKARRGCCCGFWKKCFGCCNCCCCKEDLEDGHL